MVYTYDRVGGYECSSRGDKRYSAFHARLEDGLSIEHHYQVNVKGYKSIKEGKGKPPKIECTHDELYEKYLDLWRRWSKLNPDVFLELVELSKPYDNKLSDMFGWGDITQARALADLLNQREIKMENIFTRFVIYTAEDVVIPKEEENHISSLIVKLLDKNTSDSNCFIEVVISKDNVIKDYLTELMEDNCIDYNLVEDLKEFSMQKKEYITMFIIGDPKKVNFTEIADLSLKNPTMLLKV